jgi:hypothetical protein
MKHLRTFESSEESEFDKYKIALEVYGEYQLECLDSDGDYSMMFDTWLEMKFPRLFQKK